MRRTKLIFIILLLILAACGNNGGIENGAEAGSGVGGGANSGLSPPPAALPPSPPLPPTPSAAPVDLNAPVLSVGMDGFISAEDAIGNLIYNQLGFKLIPVNVREDDFEALSSMAAADNLPDLFRVSVTSALFLDWAKSQALREWNPSYPALQKLMSESSSLAAVKHLYGGKSLFMPLADTNEADPGRIFYRKDWLAELELPAPETTEDFAAMLESFYQHKKRPGLTLAGGVTYLMAMFGPDPYAWVNENGQWIPAYYSAQMIPGLQFARTLYANKWLDAEFAITKANAAVNRLSLGGTGSLIRYGGSWWTQHILASFAETNGISVKEAYSGYIGILPPLSAVWPRNIQSSGIVMPAAASDETMDDAQALLNFILSEESAELAYFGPRGETSGADANGKLRLFIDPSTAKPFNIIERYPAAQVLFLLGEPFSAPLPPGTQAEIESINKQYNAAVPPMDNGYLAHFIHTPAREQFEDAVNISALFNAIVIGTAPVEEMFADFTTLCEEFGVRKMITEVNTAIP